MANLVNSNLPPRPRITIPDAKRELPCRRTNSEYDTLPACPSAPPNGTIEDMNEVVHSLDITAATLYDAVARALALLQRW
jgi:hypothetical protein